VLIAEELVLTALDPVRGRPVNGSGGVLPVCLTGALAAELALAGAVTWGGRRFEAAGAPPADPLLRDVHAALPDVGGRRAADQLRRLDKGRLRPAARPRQAPDRRSDGADAGGRGRQEGARGGCRGRCGGRHGRDDRGVLRLARPGDRRQTDPPRKGRPTRGAVRAPRPSDHPL
jgi:hypothetical protein